MVGLIKLVMADRGGRPLVWSMLLTHPGLRRCDSGLPARSEEAQLPLGYMHAHRIISLPETSSRDDVLFSAGPAIVAFRLLLAPKPVKLVEDWAVVDRLVDRLHPLDMRKARWLPSKACRLRSYRMTRV
jgi:hypothetical protein